MTLAAGTRIGAYEVKSPLGQGGMGVVYRAHDTQLQRDVAIKLLPEPFATDPDRLTRFQREAQVLASLNHPNIAQVYGIEGSGVSRCIVMELVDGETLQERLKCGSIPIDEALPLAKQIAEALEAAHEKGITHRDLKPGNIKLTNDGRAKVLDFGLAKMHEPQGAAVLSHSPTMLSASTPGMIMGTAAYMSPEQAKGKEVGPGTDIWAFGCVLYEMLTGHTMFQGDTTAEILAEIFKTEPDWNQLPSSTPTSIRRLLRRCLQKDQKLRLHDIADARIEIQEALSGIDEDAKTVPAKVWPRRLLAAVAAVFFVVLTLIGFLSLSRSHAENPHQTWSGTRLGGPPIAYGPRVSPDGKLLAFVALINGQSQVGVMNPTSGNWNLLTHDQNAGWVKEVSWSVDGTKIYFSRLDALPLGVFSVPALGGEPRLILENAEGPEPLKDGSLLVARINPDRVEQLYRLKPDTGEVQALNAFMPTDVTSYRAFPDGNEIVFYGTPADHTSAPAKPHLHVLDLKGGMTRAIGPDLNVPPFALLGISVNPLDKSVLVQTSNGDLGEITAISTDGRSPDRVLLTLTGRVFSIDLSSDGSLYIDQVERPVETVRFSEGSRTPEAMAAVPVGDSPVLELPDKRFLLTSIVDGHARLLAAKTSGELVPFIDTDEETRGPVALVGGDRVAFILGKPPEQFIAIASIKDGRVSKRFRISAADTIRSLSASSDASTFFYGSGGTIWSISVSAGEARKLGAGDAVAFDPFHGDLIIQLNQQDAVRLARMPRTGGPIEPIPITSGLRIPSATFLSPQAVRMDGKIAVSVGSKDSWFFGAGILDAATGKLQRVPLRYDADISSISWNQKNEMVTGAFLMRSSLWRFRPDLKK
jgi:serine/threonine protein kinase